MSERAPDPSLAEQQVEWFREEYDQDLPPEVIKKKAMEDMAMLRTRLSPDNAMLRLKRIYSGITNKNFTLAEIGTGEDELEQIQTHAQMDRDRAES